MQAKNSHNTKASQILIIFETTNYRPYSFESIIQLAARINAVIHGIYIEDQDLLSAVELPFIREIEHHTANVRHTDSLIMSRQLRDYAEKIKSLLQTQAGAFSVKATFSSVRGRRLSAIEQHLNSAELILLPAHKSLSDNGHEQKKPTVKKYIAVIYDKSPASEHCLSIAISIAQTADVELLILTNTREVSTSMKNQNIKYALVTIDVNQSGQVFSMLNHYIPDLLLVPASSQLLNQEHFLQKHINRFNYDVMIVR